MSSSLLRRAGACALVVPTGALILVACDRPFPKGSKTAEAMPDTSKPGPNPPDAADTGLVPPGGDPAVQPGPPPARSEPPGSPDVPVDLPAVDRSPSAPR